MDIEEIRKLTEESKKQIRENLEKDSTVVYEAFIRTIEGCAKAGKNEAIVIESGDPKMNTGLWDEGIPFFIEEKKAMALERLMKEGFKIYYYHRVDRGYEDRYVDVFGPVSPIKQRFFTVGTKEYKAVKVAW